WPGAGGTGWPQPASACCSSGVPHCGQLLAAAATGVPHVVHVIPGPLPRPATGAHRAGPAVQKGSRSRRRAAPGGAGGPVGWRPCGDEPVAAWSVLGDAEQESGLGHGLDRVPLVGHGEEVALTALPGRSEEHTSELQSRFDLVCRLLLEKK